MSLLDLFKKKDDSAAAPDSLAFIADIGTRDAIRAVLKIIVPMGVAYAVAGGYIPESASQAMTAKAMDLAAHAMEIGVVLYALVAAWRHAHHKDAEVSVASAMPAGTPRQVIRDVARELDAKDIQAMMPPPQPPMPPSI